MKKLILLELLLLFLATTFQSDNPPGWYQQTLPVNDFINDIFFLDSLNGWVVTNSDGAKNDTGYVMKTTNGGINWFIQFQGIIRFNVVQFLNGNYGYTMGAGNDGRRKMYKSTNGGDNWLELNALNQVGIINDLNFVNKDTGWVCSNDFLDGGVFKTTDGGNSFQTQLGASYHPIKIFFIKKDTGWFINDNANGLYRTTNGGINWNLQFTSVNSIGSIFFLNGKKGWMRGGSSTYVISYTTDGGFNWLSATGNTGGGFDIKFVNDSIGYTGMVSNRITKSTDGGRTWGYQASPNSNNLSVSFLKNDILKGWAGGTGIVHTEDGGGLIVKINNINSEIPNNFNLFQNYPNPFNPKTVISYQLTVSSFINLRVYDVLGNEIKTLVNQRQNAGEYKVEFEGNQLTSGVYFYELEVFDEKTNHVFSETKKMLLVK